MKKLSALLITVIAVGASVTAYSAAHKEAENKKNMPYEVSKIMSVGMKGDKKKGVDGLVSKVIEGEASKDEQKDLLRFFLSLEKYSVEKGDQKAFDKKADALTDSLVGVIAGVEGSIAKLEKAKNCKACHDAHKPE